MKFPNEICEVKIQKICLPIAVLLILSGKIAYAQNIQVLNFEQLEHRFKKNTDSTYFINFWATWCLPCVKELPIIDSIGKKYDNENLKILLVSLDFSDQLETRLIPFINKNNITNEVVLLDAPNYNSWIDKVSEDWSGGIPASLIYNNNSRDFFEKSFDFHELDSIIKSKLKY